MNYRQLLLLITLLSGWTQVPAKSDDSVYTCIGNSDGTSTCVSSKASRSLTCTAAGSGVVSCTNTKGDHFNCMMSAGNIVTCRDPDTNEEIDCVGTGFGENACKRLKSNPVKTDVINESDLFSKPLGVPDEAPMPGMNIPEVIVLPGAFESVQ